MMNFPKTISLLKYLPARRASLLNSLFYLLLLTTSIINDKNCYADEELWQFNHTLQSYLQTYQDTSDRKNAINTGYFISADYLDSGSLGFAYYYTLVNLSNNADVTENLFYLGGQYHIYPDSLPGKLSLRFDTYFGDEVLEYNIATPPPTIPGPGPGPGHGKINTKLANPDIIQETTDINIYYSQLSFINYKKTFYTDVGYAYSEYDSSAKTEVNQLTPTISFGWNNSYDWLQLRVYFIELKQNISTYNDDSFNSLEAKYTHWLADDSASKLEFVRFTLLSGERVLAVDPDATAVYSITDIQKTSISASVQWKLSQKTKALALIQYDQFQNATLANDYDGYLFYINIQFKN